ncbi:MAG TPA: superoxide dismutase family protein [Tepidisphaeraceae bacterium]
MKHEEASPKAMMQDAAKVAVAELKPSAAAATQPANNHVTGTVTFTELADGKVKITAHIMGLTPNTKHGFHIHEKGDLNSPDLMSTGGHYNPDKHVHGGPTTSPVHAGDFGNVTSDASGMAMFELTVDDISIGGPKNDILGKAVIVHAKEDDLKSQPSGNAGARVAGGIIELKK